MNLDNLTLGDIHKLKQLLQSVGDTPPTPTFPAEPGEKVLIRTVTVYHVGRVVRVEGNFLHLEGASWVADTGRFGEAISKGTLSEVEYVDRVAIAINSIVDVFQWKHDLPSSSK